MNELELQRRIDAKYDRNSDVLYVNLGEPVPVEGDGLPRGVELDFSAGEGRPCGLTVIGFRRNGWADTLSELTAITAAHLSISRACARGAIKSAVEELNAHA